MSKLESLAQELHQVGLISGRLAKQVRVSARNGVPPSRNPGMFRIAAILQRNKSKIWNQYYSAPRTKQKNQAGQAIQAYKRFFQYTSTLAAQQRASLRPMKRHLIERGKRFQI